MKRGIPAGIVVAVGVAIFAIMMTIQNEPPEVEESEWISSGPFAINKAEYRLGEKIAYSISGLTENETGRILFISPGGITAYIQEFDGKEKCCFNQYWEPDTSGQTGIYKVEELVGGWLVEFEGTTYLPIQFRVTEEWVPGANSTLRDIERPPVFQDG